MKKICAVCVAFLICLTACSSLSEATEDSSIVSQYYSSDLNARQKQILLEMELPTDYNKLNHSQRIAIQRIEVMLKYLEDKYGMEFSYAGYVPAGLMESEYLIAYPTAEGSGDGANIVIVEPDGDTFKDNYANKEIREYYEKLCTDFVNRYFQSEQAKVIFYGFSTSMTASDEITDECFHYKISTNTLFFVSDTICDEEQMREFAETMKLWFEVYEIKSRARVSLIYGDVTDITSDNIADYYRDKLNLSGDYNIYIYGDEIERNQLVPNSRGKK